MKSCHFDNMNESRGYFAEPKKPDRGRQILPDLSYMWNLKKKKKGKQNHRNRTNEWLVEGLSVGKIGVEDEEL